MYVGTEYTWSAKATFYLPILFIFNVRNQILIYIPDWLITHCPLKSLHELVHDFARDNHHPRPLKAELGWSRKTSETAAHESCNDLTCVSGLIFYRTCTTSYNATYGMRDVDMCNVYNSHVAALPFTTTCARLNQRRCHSWELWRELTFSDTQICACGVSYGTCVSFYCTTLPHCIREGCRIFFRHPSLRQLHVPHIVPQT